MKLKLPLIAAFVGALSLTACGGGSSGDNSPAVTVDNPASLTITEVTLGTGATAVNGSTATIVYKAYLYKAGAAESKGTMVDPGTQPLTWVVGQGNFIQGLQQGVIGMKEGGKRQLAIPASLAYGASGYGSVPPNSGILFEMTLSKVN